MSGLYIHIPFCRKKCDYCSFYSIAPTKELIDLYLDKLELEADSRLQSCNDPVKTIFTGGGDPFVLAPEQLNKLKNIVLKNVETSQIKEWTFEGNPENLTNAKAEILALIPALRISMGIQRLKDDELFLLGRRARFKQIEKAAEICFSFNFNTGFDFIIGVPGCESIADDLSRFLQRFPVRHISSYFLSIEPDTPISKKFSAQEIADTGPEELFEVRDLLTARGFEHYEISNFALENSRCLHNLNYWYGKDYIGLGPAAVSTCNSLRTCNPPDLQRYLKNEPGEVEKLSPVEKRNEYLMLRLRLLRDGLDLVQFAEKFGEPDKDFYLTLQLQIEQKNIAKSGKIIKLTDKGIIFADNVMSELFA
ncbi:MAG: radical SAM family heme chaperone HemW [Candidatus Rifleibacteriota bacterium]